MIYLGMKPKILYHASSNRNIKEFEPRAESVRDPNEGPVVFATPNKADATKFLVSTSDEWTALGAFGGVSFAIISDKKRFEKADKGGAIYSLPSDTFDFDPEKGTGDKEWTSREKVKPLSKEEYESGLEAMIDHGIQVFFVDKETSEKIQKSNDHGNKIIRGLESENKKRGENFTKIPDIHQKTSNTKSE